MKRINRIISFLLCITLLSSVLGGCANNVENIDVSLSKNEPQVNISLIEDFEPTEKDEALSEEAQSDDVDIGSMVSEAIKYDLTDRGYIAEECVAFSNDQQYKETGIGYYLPDVEFFDDKDYAGLGFVSIVGPEDEYKKLPDNYEYIAVEPIDGNFENGAQYNILAYTSESFDTGHFVYDNQYVVYYPLDSTTVKYEMFENDKKNYDLDIGSLYDFDNDTYIYNADLFDGYTTHSGVELFSEEDYEALEEELRLLSEQQEKNGYYVEELNIVYISPENIEAYLASGEEDTFFGYSVSDLENSLGQGKALVYTEDGFQTAEYYEENPQDYNWKSFLIKLGIGCGIILVGAVLTPVTGGASFGCALLTISKVTVGFALSSGLGTLAIETVSNLIKGDDIETAITHASCKGLDSFANGFMIGAAVASVGVVSGLIKPVACFTAGTLVAVPMDGGIGYKKIEDLSEGDMVYSYNEISEEIEPDLVTRTIHKNSDDLIEIIINNDTIHVTGEHPFYCENKNGWVSAKDLNCGDQVLLIDGSVADVSSMLTIPGKEEDVYNLTIRSNHNYFVGNSGVLVHNECSKVIADRQKGVRDAWKKEVEAVKKGKSKYNWTEKEVDELLKKGKVPGYDGCHIVDVQANPELAANPDNIIFLKHEVHINVVHQGNTNNLSRWGEIIKIMPQFKEQILAIGGLL